jgi:hypothetical protein
MDDLTAKNQIESFFNEFMKDYFSGGLEEIERIDDELAAWGTEIEGCNSYIYVFQKGEPDPYPISELSLRHPENLPMGGYYLLIDIDPDSIGEERTIEMLRGIKDQQVFVRYFEDNIPLTPVEAIEVLTAK